MVNSYQINLGNARDFDFVCVFFCPGEVIGRLESEPRFSAAAKSFVEPDRHLWEIAAFPLTRLFNACLVTPRIFAPWVTEIPSG